MATLSKHSFSNLWFVDGKEVANIIVYDATGILLNTGRRWIDLPMSGQSLPTFPGFTGSTVVAKRNAVRFDRWEHFFYKDTLYVNAGLFNGYSTVSRPRTVIDTERCQTAERAEITLVIGSEDWVISEQCYSNYQNTPLGDRCDAVREIYNREVSDHPNRHLSQWATARLIRALPDMVEAAKISE